MNANQFDLFGEEEKSYPGANGVKLPYWEQDGKIIRIALSDKLILLVTYQKGRPHLYGRPTLRQNRIQRQKRQNQLLVTCGRAQSLAQSLAGTHRIDRWAQPIDRWAQPIDRSRS